MIPRPDADNRDLDTYDFHTCPETNARVDKILSVFDERKKKKKKKEESEGKRKRKRERETIRRILRNNGKTKRETGAGLNARAATGERSLDMRP